MINCSRTNFTQIIGPFYLRVEHPYSQNIFSIVTKTTRVTSEDRYDWGNFTTNVIHGQGFLESCVLSGFRFSMIIGTHKLLSWFKPYGYKSEFATWTRFPLLGNIEFAPLIYDITCAIRPLFFECSSIFYTIPGTVIGMCIGLPRTTSVLFTWAAAPDTISGCLSLMVPAGLYLVNRNTNKFGVSQEWLKTAGIITTAPEMNTAEMKAENVPYGNRLALGLLDVVKGGSLPLAEPWMMRNYYSQLTVWLSIQRALEMGSSPSPTSQDSPLPKGVKAVSNDGTVSGDFTSTGLPMMIEELHANAVSLGVSVIWTLPERVAGRRYLLVDSDKIAGVRNRNDIVVVHQDIQGNTASCGDNALITARKAQVAGLESYIYVKDRHATVLVPCGTQPPSLLLDSINNAEVSSTGISWEGHKKLMAGWSSQSSFTTDTSQNILSYLTPWLKQWYYRSEIRRLTQLLQNRKTKISWQDALTPRGYKQVALLLHPDKNHGQDLGFTELNNLYHGYTNQDNGHIIHELLFSALKAYDKLLVGITFTNFVIDAVRLHYEPKELNWVKIATSSMYLFGLVTSVPQFSIAASAAPVVYTCSNTWLGDECTESAITAGKFMALTTLVPVGLAALGCHPLAITTATLGLAGYSLYDNIRSLPTEVIQDFNQIIGDSASWL